MHLRRLVELSVHRHPDIRLYNQTQKLAFRATIISELRHTAKYAS